MEPGELPALDDVVAERRALNAEPWRARAHCHGLSLDVFFDPRYVELALEVCGRCSVVDECRRFADDNGIREGIYGGTTANQRRRVTRSPRRSPPGGSGVTLVTLRA
jgi:WhiB family redox-sensing transcriptional regulator